CSAAEGAGPARCPADPDGDAALAQPGGLYAAQRRALRAELRGVYALYLTDPALSGPAGTPRHPLGDPLAAQDRSGPAQRRRHPAQGGDLSLRSAGAGAPRRAVLAE